MTPEERFEARCLRENEYTLAADDAEPGTPYAFWRVVEHTGAGWFPWPGLYTDKAECERIVAQARERL